MESENLEKTDTPVFTLDFIFLFCFLQYRVDITNRFCVKKVIGAIQYKSCMQTYTQLIAAN